MDVFDILHKAAQTFESLDVPYFVTGSMATIAYGEPRLTIDVDIVAKLPTSKVPSFCDAFPTPEFYCSDAMIKDAILRRSQFNIIHTFTGLKVDVMIPVNSEFNRKRLERRIIITTRGAPAYFATPEDAILKKLEYLREGGSEKHIRDIKSVLLVQGARIDFDYLNTWAAVLGVVEQLAMITDDLDKT
jgi:hypothetical protein